MNNEATENNSNEGFFGHPIGLRTLFLTEMWGADVLLWDARASGALYDWSTYRL